MTGPGLLLVVSGPSGVGKGTVVERLLGMLPGARRSVSVTTRPRRPGERDGLDYRFVDDGEFDGLVAGEGLLEWATYAGYRYGTPRRWVEEALAAGHVVILEIDVQGALQIRDRVPGAVLVFVAPPSMGELARRLEERGTEDPAERRARLEVAGEELARQQAFDHVLVNDDADRCAAELRDLVTASRAAGG